MKMTEIWLIGTIIQAVSEIIDKIVTAVKEKRAIDRLKKYEKERVKGTTDGTKTRDIGDD